MATQRKPIFLTDSTAPGAVSLNFFDPTVAKQVLNSATTPVPSRIYDLVMHPARQKGPWVVADCAHWSVDEEVAFYGLSRAVQHRPVNQGPAHIAISPGKAENDNWQATLDYAVQGAPAQVDVTHLLPQHLADRFVKAGVTQTRIDGSADGQRHVSGLDVFLTCPERKHHFLVHRRPPVTGPWLCNDTEELVRANLAIGKMDSVIYDPRLATPADLQGFFSAAALHMAGLGTPHLPPAPGQSLPVTWKI